jgi:hypothetical protein
MISVLYDGQDRLLLWLGNTQNEIAKCERHRCDRGLKWHLRGVESTVTIDTVRHRAAWLNLDIVAASILLNRHTPSGLCTIRACRNKEIASKPEHREEEDHDGEYSKLHVQVILPGQDIESTPGRSAIFPPRENHFELANPPCTPQRLRWIEGGLD